MSEKIEFVLELTREEALGLLLLCRASGGFGFVYDTVARVGHALDMADRSLHHQQFDLWAQNDPATNCRYRMSDTIPTPKGWI